MKAVPMTEALANELLNREGLEEVRATVQPHLKALLQNSPHAYAVLDEKGTVIFCAGVMIYWKDRGEAWAFFAPDAGKHFTRIHKMVKTFLDAYTVRRIEATVKLNFPRGIKWVRLLGFKEEASVLAQYKDGEDYALYSYVDPKPLS